MLFHLAFARISTRQDLLLGKAEVVLFLQKGRHVLVLLAEVPALDHSVFIVVEPLLKQLQVREVVLEASLDLPRVQVVHEGDVSLGDLHDFQQVLVHWKKTFSYLFLY